MTCPKCGKDCGRLVEIQSRSMPVDEREVPCVIDTEKLIGIRYKTYTTEYYVCDYCGEHWEVDK